MAISILDAVEFETESMFGMIINTGDRIGSSDISACVENVKGWTDFEGLPEQVIRTLIHCTLSQMERQNYVKVSLPS